MDITDRKRLDVILLVEDEEDHARLIKRALNERGNLLNEVVWVKNGKEALDYINRSGVYNQSNAPRPGLILLDIKLPLKDGFEVLKALKDENQFKHIPIVMLTTTSNSEDVRKALAMGANDYIVKPVKFSDFVDKVGQLGNYWAFVSDSVIGN